MKRARSGQAVWLDRWLPAALDDVTLRKYCAQLANMVLIHADKTLFPSLTATVRTLLAELERATSAPPEENILAEAMLGSVRQILEDMRNQLSQHMRGVGQANQAPDVEALVAAVGNVSRALNAVYEPRQELQSTISALMMKLFPEPRSDAVAHVMLDIIQNVEDLDLEGLAELGDADAIKEVLKTAGNQTVSPNPVFFGARHRTVGEPTAPYLFQLVGLHARAPDLVEQFILDADLEQYADDFHRIGRAAQRLRGPRARRARPAREVAADIVRAAAAVDNFATVEAAIRTQFFLYRANINGIDPWRVIAARGRDIMVLHNDYNTLFSRTKPDARMAQLAGRARSIWESI